MTDEHRAAEPARLEWRVATVVALRDETPHARTLVLDVPDWPGQRAGQHVDVRLVAEDGYVAQRSYSIASAPEDAMVALTVERIDGAEVSPYLCDVIREGDGLEVRGPIGGYFVWEMHRAGRWSSLREVAVDRYGDARHRARRTRPFVRAYRCGSSTRPRPWTA